MTIKKQSHTAFIQEDWSESEWNFAMNFGNASLNICELS